ncbi:hypothetical protein GCM10011506_09260 [Marivirga lumbricoides]|uniref:Uncharacterized protein n=1 Tax=Marivirga lumbricoides TaxID=1046115 RepID=A0ABQ1LRM3_9BACT|nr:hypothetical protein GCM10011506_09260 [Marivirga lumbricoides]
MKQFFRFLTIHAKYLYQNHFYYRKHTSKTLRELEGQFDIDSLSFTKSQLKRIKLYKYVGLYVNDCFATLRGERMSPQEIKLTFCLSLLTPLLDDLTDNQNLSSYQILSKLQKKSSVDDSKNLQVANNLYHTIMKECQHEVFPDIFKEALISQDESLQQLGKVRLSHASLMQITRAKGSAWTLLFRLMLQHPLKEGEREVVQRYGAIIQLTNDMFDVYKDLQNGQQTCFTNAHDIELMQKEYENQVAVMIQNLCFLSYPKKAIYKSLYQLMIMIALGKVCLKQLKNCQQQSGGIFITANYLRQQLICDMEKWGNRFDYMENNFKLYAKVNATNKGNYKLLRR